MPDDLRRPLESCSPLARCSFGREFELNSPPSPAWLIEQSYYENRLATEWETKEELTSHPRIPGYHLGPSSLALHSPFSPIWMLDKLPVDPLPLFRRRGIVQVSKHRCSVIRGRVCVWRGELTHSPGISTLMLPTTTVHRPPVIPPSARWSRRGASLWARAPEPYIRVGDLNQRDRGASPLDDEQRTAPESWQSRTSKFRRSFQIRLWWQVVMWRTTFASTPIIARGLDDKLPGAHGKLDTASRAVFFSFRHDDPRENERRTRLTAWGRLSGRVSRWVSLSSFSCYKLTGWL